MSDAFLFEQFPEWLGENFLAVLLVLAVAIIAFVLAILRLFQRHKGRSSPHITARRGVTRLLKGHPRIAAFLGNPYAPEYRLVRYLLLGLILGGASLYGFMNVLDELLEMEEMETLDRTLAAAVHKHAMPLATVLFRSITWLGNPLVLSGVGFTVGLVLLVQRHWMPLIAWIGSLAGGALLNVGLKVAIERGRPELTAAMYAEGWSFPSGHAMGATTAFGMLAYLAASRFRAYLNPVIASAVLLILLIGASRIYLGVHYLSDVVGGFLAGTVWLMICVTACELAGTRTLRQQMKAKR